MTSKDSPTASPTASSLDLEGALRRLFGTDAVAGYAQRGMAITGVPGMAIAVVYQGQVVRTGHWGVKRAHTGELVDADTVFALASLSKPITSTIVAQMVAKGALKWNDPVAMYDRFPLHTEQATSEVTIAALLAHRSGLPDHAGDWLEDMGWPRETVLKQLQYIALTRRQSMEPYACPYAYTNFGFTEAALAATKAANAKGMEGQWETLAERLLFQPLGMTRTSSRYEDLLGRDNRALPHQRRPSPRVGQPPFPASEWFVPEAPRDPDAQSPAGGVSSSVNDLARWMLFQLRAETGTDAVSAAIRETHEQYAGWKYGFGWNSSSTAADGPTLSHSGGFVLGAATTVMLLPRYGLGIVALTNGQPIGLPEAVCRTFTEDFCGRPGEGFESVLAEAGRRFQELLYPLYDPDYDTNPPHPQEPARIAAAYQGSFLHPLYGRVTVKGSGASGSDPFSLVVGAREQAYPLSPWNKDIFTYQPTGENALGRAGVVFGFSAGARKADTVTLQNLTVPTLVGDELKELPAVFRREHP